MFGFGSKKAKLEAKHKKLLEEAYRLSSIDRAKSDEKIAEAEKISKELDQLGDAD